MEQTFEMIAKTFQGLEEVLAAELTALGADNIEMGRRMVSFTGDKEMLYRANFCLRTALRILKPIKHFTATDADAVYEAVKEIRWEDYLDPAKSFAVDATVFSEEFRHSKFVSYRVKDAIADYFRERTGKRPSVSITNPDVLLNIHIAQTSCTLSLDSSGESLHRRGYRQEAVEAPLNEVLAAGMILLTGWKGECDLIDPMCGSGTIPIEAALIARNIAPGVFRQGYAFENWPDFDTDLLERIYNDDSQEREFAHKIYGYDNSIKANAIAQRNVKAAGVGRDIVLKVQPFQQFEQPQEKSLIITNPPYGERISSTDLLGLYQMIGERLKHAFTGNTAWVLSYPARASPCRTAAWTASSASTRYSTASTRSSARAAKHWTSPARPSIVNAVARRATPATAVRRHPAAPSVRMRRNAAVLSAPNVRSATAVPVRANPIRSGNKPTTDTTTPHETTD